MPELGELTDKEFEELLERVKRALEVGLKAAKEHMQKLALEVIEQGKEEL